MKIAVTAASGKLGTAIVNALIKEIGAENVIGIVRTPENAKHLGIEVRKGDYNNFEEYKTTLKGIDKVLLISGMDEPQKRIPQHRNVINAAKENGVKKIVYTSIIGAKEGNAFSPIVQSNRQTEQDVKDSGMDWVIGRNGIYIEPDLDYLETYKNEGEIRNCAADGKCIYTSRGELGFAYAKMLIEEHHNTSTYNLGGETITQQQLANRINEVYGTNLSFHNVSVEDYTKERQAVLGDFLGEVIAGIYTGIKDGKYNVASDFKKATQREHQSVQKMILDYKQTN